MNRELYIYKRINLIVAGIILGIFLYSGIFSYTKANYPISSNQKYFSSDKTISTGLSRSFSAIMRFDFQVAQEFNPHGISLFVFFASQLLLRCIWLLLATKTKLKLKSVIATDLVLSTLLFVIHFAPFISSLVHR